MEKKLQVFHKLRGSPALPKLFIAQRDHGIDSRGAARWNVAGNGRNQNQDK